MTLRQTNLFGDCMSFIEGTWRGLITPNDCQGRSCDSDDGTRTLANWSEQHTAIYVYNTHKYISYISSYLYMSQINFYPSCLPAIEWITVLYIYTSKCIICARCLLHLVVLSFSSFCINIYIYLYTYII